MDQGQACRLAASCTRRRTSTNRWSARRCLVRSAPPSRCSRERAERGEEPFVISTKNNDTAGARSRGKAGHESTLAPVRAAIYREDDAPPGACRRGNLLTRGDAERVEGGSDVVPTLHGDRGALERLACAASFVEGPLYAVVLLESFPHRSPRPNTCKLILK